MARPGPRFGVLAIAAALSGGAACLVHGAAPAYALYQPPRLESNQVALLLGSIATVDDKDVSAHGSTFELLPGCHIITTQTKLLAFDSNGVSTPQGSVTGTLPRLVYAIEMGPGHTYVIERQIQTVGGNGADVQITARDVAADGQSVELLATRSLNALAACRARFPP